MPPLWLLIDIHDVAALAAGLFFAGSLVVAAFLAEFINARSTVERSTSAGSPAPAGVDRWVVAASERETACAAATPAPPPLVAAETTQVAAQTCPTPVGVGDPTP
jgi:hypothetical protein